MTDADPSKADEAEAPVVLAEPVPPSSPQPPAAPAKRRSGVFAGFLGGVLAVGAGFGAAHYVPQGWPLALTTAAAPSPELTALQAEVARLAALPAPQPDAALADRIAALEAATPVQPDLAPLQDRLAALEQRLTALEALPTDGSAVSPAALAALRAEVAALKAGGGAPADLTALAAEAEARLKEAQAQAEALRAETVALTQETRARSALGQVMAAMDSGAPFAGVLPDLGEVPEPLAALAAAGVPTVQSLRDGFPQAARAALEASLRADMGATWAERIGSFLQSQTGARSLTPREGTDPDAVLSRAEAALAAGDLAATLAELDGLPDPGKAALADWRARAEARLAAQAALTGLAARIGG